MDPDFGDTGYNFGGNKGNNYNYNDDLADEMNSPNYGQMGRNLSDQQALKDQQIDQLVNVAGNMKNIAGQIKMDIDDESGLLDEVGDGAKFVNDHVQATTNKTAKVRLNGKDKMSLFIIFVLIIVLIVVIILAILF